jgi:hypothetical protein
MMFDPSQHLSKLSGKDYLEVKWRLVWLRDKHPDAQLVTELVEHAVGEYAVVKAGVQIPSTGAQATGYGSETPRDFRDYLEKAETKAIGRALAALGFGTQFTTDLDDAEHGRIADSPVGRPAQKPTANGQDNSSQRTATLRTTKASDASPHSLSVDQLNAIDATRREIGNDKWVDDLIAKHGHTGSIDAADLYSREASIVIREMNQRLKEIRAAKEIATRT